MLLGFSLLDHTEREAPPVTGRLIKLRRYWMSQKSGKGDALRKEKAFLQGIMGTCTCYVSPLCDLWSRAGRDPPVLLLIIGFTFGKQS